MNSEVGLLDLVKDGPRLFPRQRRMGQEIEKILNGPLEVDVVLPEGVVGVEDEVLQAHVAGQSPPAPAMPIGPGPVAGAASLTRTRASGPRRPL